MSTVKVLVAWEMKCWEKDGNVDIYVQLWKSTESRKSVEI